VHSFLFLLIPDLAQLRGLLTIRREIRPVQWLRRRSSRTLKRG
jgi:hypothetical protein